ncbi:MAG: hypothetical protein D084_Lepto4C00626G0004 [Leptospirillum sp. Group IV 'UBA BS']|nr:MAG: hypothetical protein D084_Lepto4C00626G0004 [Leptospirillum sp. Group IV 'UBA BS']
MAYAVFTSRDHCEKNRARIMENPPFLTKGWPYLYICLPARVRPFYFAR